MFLFTEPVLTRPVDRGFLGIHEGAQHLVGLPLHRQVQVLHVEPHVDTPGIPGWKALEDGSWEKRWASVWENVGKMMEMTLVIYGFHRKNYWNIRKTKNAWKHGDVTIVKWKPSGVDLEKTGGGNIGI